MPIVPSFYQSFIL